MRNARPLPGPDPLEAMTREFASMAWADRPLDTAALQGRFTEQDVKRYAEAARAEASRRVRNAMAE